MSSHLLGKLIRVLVFGVSTPWRPVHNDIDGTYIGVSPSLLGFASALRVTQVVRCSNHTKSARLVRSIMLQSSSIRCGLFQPTGIAGAHKSNVADLSACGNAQAGKVQRYTRIPFRHAPRSECLRKLTILSLGDGSSAKL